MTNDYKGNERRVHSEERRHLGWHLDKRVPISILLILAIQSASTIWFISGLDKQVEHNTNRIEQVNQKAVAAFKHAQSMNERLARIEERTQHTVRLLERMQNREDRGRNEN